MTRATILTRATSAVIIAALSLLVPTVSAGASQKNKDWSGGQQRSAPKEVKQKQPRPGVRQRTLPPEQRRMRVEVEQQRTARYRDHLRDYDNAARARADALRQQNRTAHYRFQQQYDERLRLQRQRVDYRRYYYNYYWDPYVYTAPVYRYRRAGTYYEVNNYGVSLLRQALNYGYATGYRAGEADRQDGWRHGYENSYAYLDANYGYPGYCVDQAEYNYYFRQGFLRGYEDGYENHHRYGRRTGETAVLLASVIAGLLILEAIDD